MDFQDPRLGRREGLLRYLLTCLDLPVPEPCDMDRFLEAAANHLGSPTIVLLDEVGVALQRYHELDNAFWEGLRALATTQVRGNLAFVLAAHESPIQLAHDCGHSSPFFNIFGYTAALGPLNDAEARALIADAPIAFSEADVDWILTRSGRWPILLNILCRERLVALEDGEIGEEWHAEGLRQIEPFRYRWSYGVLDYNGEGAIVARDDLTRDLGDDLDRILNLLIRRELIEPAEGGYHFQVELIRRWFAQPNK